MGGNFGSLVIDVYGNLIGFNFDCIWYSIMSDINYDFLICCNIMVDVCYIFFIVDKFAGVGYFVDEMMLVYFKLQVVY